MEDSWFLTEKCKVTGNVLRTISSFMDKDVAVRECDKPEVIFFVTLCASVNTISDSNEDKFIPEKGKNISEEK